MKLSQPDLLKIMLTSNRDSMRSLSDNPVRRRRAFTLLEVLIATTVTLVLMLGLSQIFKVLGDSITKGRAGLELNNRLRNVLHRVRTDLNNVTVDPRPPMRVGSGQGYMKYYEGPGSDKSFVGDPRISVTGNPLLSRYGDFDDIFMGTIKAQDSWFTGKVPRFIVERREPSSVAEMTDLVTISSQYAEVVMWVQPEVAQLANGLRDNTTLALNPLAYADVDGDSFPDRLRIHYRLLLIRPDLNMPYGLLPAFPAYNTSNSVNPNPNNRVMIAGPEVLNATPMHSPTCDMYRIHQICDLSVRRVYDSADGLAGSLDYVAANSLEDLANPVNRFAHVVYPLNNNNTATTLPVLALSQPLPFQRLLLEDNGDFQVPTVAGSGLLHPAFSLMGLRTGEDVLSTDVLAFDLKVFDASCPVIGFVGQDGQPGIAGTDDNQNGNADDARELGWIGTDDVVLRPSDPAYVHLGLGSIGQTPASVVLAYGDFVDLGWGCPDKLATRNVAGIKGFNGLSAAQRNLLSSEFSGISASAGTRDFTSAFYKSGLLKRGSNSFLQVYQPSYDTFSDHYERDGLLQAQILGTGTAVSLVGMAASTEAWRTTIDAGYDGIDNDGDGTADNVSEHETSPPFMTNLRGLQISIRLEDRASKQFKQMSTVKQFVTN